jgi:hypothetical protein
MKKRRNDLNMTQKKIMNDLTREPKAKCKVDGEAIKDFWSNRLSHKLDFNEDELIEFYRIEQVSSLTQGKEMIHNLFHVKQ